MSSILIPSDARQSFTDLRLGALSNVRALVTTKWERGYTQRVLSNIESFFVDSSIDNDADSWEIQFGDPRGEMLALLERNNEVRVEVISSEKGAAGHIFTGIADDVSYDQTGVLTVTGRDYASLALDATCPPSRWKYVKPSYVIHSTARALGYMNISLADGIPAQVKKTIKTDGSESYWEFWYRLYRNEKMWLWTGPNGALIGNRLNYDANPAYFFGTPQNTDPQNIKNMYVPVETIEIRKSTQGRFAEVWVLMKDGKKTQMVSTGLQDPTIRDWIRRPFKIIQDTESHTVQHARKTGWEEIFEGKVGSLEIRLTVSMPNWIFRTNKIAKVRIPEIGYGGEFFVIGWKMQADRDGWVQEIRLREKYIAMSRRVPHEPTITPPRKLPTENLPGHSVPDQQTKQILSTLIPNGKHPNWADFFYKAAQKWSGGWDTDLFLACLLGISYLQSHGIFNVREYTNHNDGTEWFPFKGDVAAGKVPAWYKKNAEAIQSNADAAAADNKSKATVPVPGTDRRSWEYIFENQIAEVEADGIAHRELGVGPMSLKTMPLKREADDRLGNSGNVDTSSVQSTQIEAYLKKRNSPLSSYGDDFITQGRKYNVDPRFMVAVAGAETSFATDPHAIPDITTGHNAWGMGPHNSYGSWPAGVEANAVWFSGSLYIGGGNTTVKSIAQHYAPPNAPNDPGQLNLNWIANVTKFLQDLGGDPNDVTYHGTPAGKSTPSASTGHSQYDGGRWDPESNIWVGARYFGQDCLGATHLDPTSGDQKSAMWEAYSYYVHGLGSHVDPSAEKKLRQVVMVAPGFLNLVDSVLGEIRANSKASGDGNSSGASASGVPTVLPPGKGWPSEADCLAAFTKGTWAFGGVAKVGTESAAVISLPKINFVQAQWYTEGRKAKINFIVIHTMQAEETSSTAKNVANWFATGHVPDPASAHYCLDDKNIWQAVKDGDTAFGVIGSTGAAPNEVSINAQSLHFEHAGYSGPVVPPVTSPPTHPGQTADQWQDEFSQAMLKLSAKLTALRAKQYGIPLVHCTPADLQAGHHGFAGHGDFSNAFPVAGGGHSDPDPNFPWTQYMGYVNDAANV